MSSWSDEGRVTPVYAAVDATLGEVTPRRGKGTLGHDGSHEVTRNGRLGQPYKLPQVQELQDGTEQSDKLYALRVYAGESFSLRTYGKVCWESHARQPGLGESDCPG